MAQNRDLSVINRVPAEQAVENIKRGEKEGVNPDGFASLKDQFEAEEKAQPIKTSDAVADTAAVSEQHANVMREDVDKLNWLERNIRFASDTIKGKDLSGELFGLSYKKALGQQLSNKEQFQILKLNSQLRELNGDREEYNYSFAESMPAEVIGGVYDFGQMVWRGRDLTAFGAVAGAGTGAAVGATTANPFGILIGSTVGAIKGATIGTGVGLIRDTLRQSTGQIYNDLSWVLKEGQKLPEQERRKLAVGGGLAMAAVSALPVGVLAKNTPFIAKIASARLFTKYMMSAQGTPLRRAMIAIAQSGAAEAFEEGSQEVIQNVATNMAETWDGSETSFIDSLTRTLGDPQTWEQAVKAGTIGGLTGATVQTGLSAVSPTVEAGLDRVISPFRRTPAEPEGTDTVLAPTDSTQDSQAVSLDDKGLRSIQLKVAIDQSIAVTKETVTNQNLPEQLDQIRQKMFEDAGMSHVWVTKEELNKWATDDDKARKALNMIQSSGVAESEVNSPIRVEMRKFLRVVEDHPDLADLVKVTPDAPSAQQHLDTLESRLNPVEEQSNVESLLVKTVEDKIANMNQGKKFLENDPQIQAQLIKDEIRSIQRNLSDQLSKEKADELVERAYKNADRLSKLNRDEFFKDIKTPEDFLNALLPEDVSPIEKIPERPVINGELFEDPTFVEDPEVFQTEEVEKLNKDYNRVKTEVAKAVRADLDKNMEQVGTIRAEFESLADRAKTRQQYEKEDQIQLVENFLNGGIILGEPTPEQQSRIDKGLPPHQINFESLSPELQVEFQDNAELQRRNVFSKDGLDVNTVAGIYSAKNPKFLLETLANTPTREEQIARNAEESDQIGGQLSDEEFEQSQTARAYENNAKLHIKEMRVLVDKYWDKFRPGIIKPALGIQQIRTRFAKQARENIGNVKVKNLNVDQWVVGERTSQRNTKQAVKDGNAEQIIREKQNAVYNSYLNKETRVAIGKVNRALKFLTSLELPSVRNELKHAGAEFEGAVNYLLDVLNLNPAYKNQGDQKAYDRFIKKMRDEGKGDYGIPEDIARWLDEPDSDTQQTPQDPSEYSVDKLLWIENHLKKITKEAEVEDQFLSETEDRTVEMIAQILNEQAVQNPEYKRERAQKQLGESGRFHRYTQSLLGMEALIKNNQFIYQELDGKIGGLYAKVLHNPIVGVGEFEGPTGMVAFSKLLGVYKDDFQAKVKKHYPKGQFKRYGIETVVVEEFKGLPNFKVSGGKVTKIDLLMILANMGNSENRAYIRNFGIDDQTMMRVLQRELSEQDFDFVQDAFWNTFRSIAPRLNALELKTKGVELDLVQPESFRAFGKTYQGGYFPIFLQRDIGIQELAEQVTESFKTHDPTKASSPTQFTPAYEGIVRSPHTKERSGSNYILDLNVNRFSKAIDDMLYDITMREPIRDVMTVLKNKQVREDIVAQVGEIKYNVLVNNLANMTKSISATNVQLYNGLQRNILNVFSSLEGAFAVNYITFSKSSALMSTLAFPQIALKMGGGNFAKYMSQVALKVGVSAAKFDMNAFKETFDLAASIDPSIGLYRAGIDDYRASAVEKMLPKKRLVNLRSYDAMKRFQEGTIEFAFSGILGGFDTVLKTYATVGVYNMYVNGDAPGHSYDSVHKGKTMQEVHEAAKAYTSQFLENTTMRASPYDKAVLQNIPFGRVFTRFWNEARNQINNYLQVNRDIRSDAKQMVNKAKTRDFAGANMAFESAGGRAMMAWSVMLASSAMMNFARFGVPFLLPEDEEDKYDMNFDTEEQLRKMPQFIGYNLGFPIDEYTKPGEGLFRLGLDNIGGSMIVFRDLMFSADSARGSAVPRRNVSIPLTQIATDIATTYNLPGAIYDMMMDGMTINEAFSELTPKEQQAFLNTVGYAVGGIPGLNQALKLNRAIEEGELTIPDGSFLNKNFIKNLNQFLEDKDMNRSLYFDKLKEVANAQGTEQEKLLMQLKQMRNKVVFKPEGQPLTDEAYEIIKYAESNGLWYATPMGSNAQGFYQFTPSTWQFVMNTPEGRAAGLTTRGRIAKDQSQQEKAVRIFSKYIAKDLTSQNVPVTIESIYFGHHFGRGAARKYARSIFLGSRNKDLPRGLLTRQVLNANPGLRRRNVRTNGDMVKYLKWILGEGEQKKLAATGR